MIIADQKIRVGEWVSKKLGKTSGLYEYQSIGIERDGKIIAGVVIDNYKKNASCSIHCAGDGGKWLNRKFLFVVFDYVFRQLQCKVVVNQVDSSNDKSIRFTSHLGFKESFRINGACENGDLIIFTLRREDCRWIRSCENG